MPIAIAVVVAKALVPVNLYSAVFSAQSRADEDRQSSDKETRAQGQQQIMYTFLSTGRDKNGRFSLQGKSIQSLNKTVGSKEGLL